MGHRAGNASAPVLPKGKGPHVRGFAFVINKEHGCGELFGGRNDSGMRIADGACLTFSLSLRRKTRAVNPEVLRTIPPWPFMFFPFNTLPRESLLSRMARKMHLLGSGSDTEHAYGTDD